MPFTLSRFELARYWEDINEDFTDAEALLDRIQELGERYQSAEGEHISVGVHRGDGSELRVGVAGDRWVLLYYGSHGDSVTLGDIDDEEAHCFLFPERTTLIGALLVPAVNAREAVRIWLQTGELRGAVGWGPW